MAVSGNISLTYIAQPSPDGLARAYLLFFSMARQVQWSWATTSSLATGFGMLQSSADTNAAGGGVGYHVSDPERYGVVVPMRTDGCDQL
jgi:glucose-1-phosphate thymidylyltransferase